MKLIQVRDKRSRSEIPSEFSLEKYQACKNWGLEEWCNAISYRANLREDWNRATRKEWDVEDVQNIYNNFKSHALRLLDVPMDPRKIYYGTANVQYIRDQCVADLFEDGADELLKDSSWWKDFCEWSDTPPAVLYGLKDSPTLIDRIEKTPTWVMKAEVLGETRTATINVDLDGADNQIIEEFQAWLRRTRNEMKLPRPRPLISSNSFSEWHEGCVLPFFDLKFYEKIFNKNYKWKDLTEALFPAESLVRKEPVSEDMVRNTISPKVLKIISEKTALILRQQLAGNHKAPHKPDADIPRVEAASDNLKPLNWWELPKA